MKVLVYFELTSQYTAELDYDELAQAWQADAAEHSEDPRVALPSAEYLRSRDTGWCPNVHADGNTGQLLVNNGTEIDSELAFVTEIEVIR